MLHTSPQEQAGIGDSGGMNVYVLETALKMAESGVSVDIFTRATSEFDNEPIQLAPGVTLRFLKVRVAGKEIYKVSKEELPAYIPNLVSEIRSQLLELNKIAGKNYYDVLHSHYWISGLVALPIAKEFELPVVHTMHTVALVKNLNLAQTDIPEPQLRIDGEQKVIEEVDALICNTAAEAASLVSLYNACPDKVHVVAPGVNLKVFTPGLDGVVSKDASRKKLNLDINKLYLLFVGRIQPHKGPEVLVNALAHIFEHNPILKSKLHFLIVGGASGEGSQEPQRLMQLAKRLKLEKFIDFFEPVNRNEIANWYRAADIVCVPSYSESFGLVALEAQACGTPVVASAVGGLRTAVADNISGLLVDGHDPKAWSSVLARLLSEPHRRIALSIGALEHAKHFGWEATVRGIFDTYDDLLDVNKTSAIQVG